MLSPGLGDGSKPQVKSCNTTIDDVTDLPTIQEFSAAGRHQECLQACQNALQANPEETYAYKYAGKSLLALGQYEKAQQCLIKAHQLDSNCLLYTSPSPRDRTRSRMPSSA